MPRRASTTSSATRFAHRHRTCSTCSLPYRSDSGYASADLVSRTSSRHHSSHCHPYGGRRTSCRDDANTHHDELTASLHRRQHKARHQYELVARRRGELHEKADKAGIQRRLAILTHQGAQAAKQQGVAAAGQMQRLVGNVQAAASKMGRAWRDFVDARSQYAQRAEGVLQARLTLQACNIDAAEKANGVRAAQRHLLQSQRKFLGLQQSLTTTPGVRVY